MSNSYMPKSFKFKQLVYNITTGEYYNIKYLPAFLELYKKNAKYMEDDFSVFYQKPLEYILNFSQKISPHCYLVVEGENLCGFFALENLVGNSQKIHSAEVIVCFDRKYWGKFTKLAAHSFKDYCFNTLKITKLKALIYPQNRAVKAILKECGFEYEATLKSETVKDGKLQDVEVYFVKSLRIKY